MSATSRVQGSFFYSIAARFLVDGNRVLWQLVGDSSWVKCVGDGIEQRGTWHETDGGSLWILVVWTLDPVASVTMLLTDTCTL